MKKFTTLMSGATLILSMMASGAYASCAPNSCETPCFAPYQAYCAEPCQVPCETDCCTRCGPKFRVGADFLLWRADIDDIDFAATGRINTIAIPPVTAINPNYWAHHTGWEPGVRVFAGVDNLLSGWDVYASYSYLGNNAQRTIVATEAEFLLSPLLPNVMLSPTFGRFQTVDSGYSSHFHAWDLLAERQLNCGGCIDVYGFMGLTGIYIDQNLDTDYRTDLITVPTSPLFLFSLDTASAHWDSNVWGIGLKVGTGIEYELIDGMSIFGKAAGMLLTGNPSSHGSFVGFDNSNGQTVESFYEDPSGTCLFIPGYHIQAGGRIAFETCGREVGIRIGYEFQSWYNLPNVRRFMGFGVEGTGLATSSNTTTYGLHGLFFGADVGF